MKGRAFAGPQRGRGSTTAPGLDHFFFSTSTGGGDGDDDNDKPDRPNPIFDLAQEQLEKNKRDALRRDAEGQEGKDPEETGHFDMDDFEASIQGYDDEGDEAVSSGNSKSSARRGVRSHLNKDLIENYKTLEKMLNVAVHAGISPYDVKKEFELQYHRPVNREEAILISKGWHQFRLYEKQMIKLHTYARELTKSISIKECRKSWQTGVMSPEELEEEKKENLKSLVRDFSGVDTRNELQMLQSPELFFYNDSEFDNEDMNQDYQDAAATRSEPNLKLVGGKYVHEDIHDTLQAATARTLALEAARKKPVSERYDGQHCASPTLFCVAMQPSPPTHTHTHTHVTKHATNHALNLFRFHPP